MRLRFRNRPTCRLMALPSMGWAAFGFGASGSMATPLAGDPYPAFKPRESSGTQGKQLLRPSPGLEHNRSKPLLNSWALRLRVVHEPSGHYDQMLRVCHEPWCMAA